MKNNFKPPLTSQIVYYDDESHIILFLFEAKSWENKNVCNFSRKKF